MKFQLVAVMVILTLLACTLASAHAGHGEEFGGDLTVGTPSLIAILAGAAVVGVIIAILADQNRDPNEMPGWTPLTFSPAISTDQQFHGLNGRWIERVPPP